MLPNCDFLLRFLCISLVPGMVFTKQAFNMHRAKERNKERMARNGWLQLKSLHFSDTPFETKASLLQAGGQERSGEETEEEEY